MKINWKKFILRNMEIIAVVISVIATIKAIPYAESLRGYHAYGGEYLIPLFGLLTVLVNESILEEMEEK